MSRTRPRPQILARNAQVTAYVLSPEKPNPFRKDSSLASPIREGIPDDIPNLVVLASDQAGPLIRWPVPGSIEAGDIPSGFLNEQRAIGTIPDTGSR